MVIFYNISLLFAVFLPTLFWLIFFLKEDPHPEPRKLLFYTFAFGGIITLPALALQVIFQKFALAFTVSPLILIFGLAFIEELSKFAATYWAIEGDPAFDEPVDAMIYMITAALGFATIENLFLLGGQTGLSSITTINNILRIIVLRSVGATLLHLLSAGLMGYYWAKGKFGNDSLKENIALGLALASLIHAFFNYLVLQFQDITLLYPTILLIVAAFFVFVDFEKLKNNYAAD